MANFIILYGIDCGGLDKSSGVFYISIDITIVILKQKTVIHIFTISDDEQSLVGRAFACSAN